MSNKRNPTMCLIMMAAFVIGTCGHVNADFIFGEPCKLPPTVNLPGYTSGAPSISADGLTLFFTSDMPGQYGNYDLWVTTRAEIDGDWGMPINLGPTVNSSASESYPDISSDGLSLFFQDGHPLWPEIPRRPGGYGLGDLWVTKRATLVDTWGTPENLGPIINSSYWDGTPCISTDGLEFYFSSNRPGGSGGHDIWMATRARRDDDWDTPVNLGPTVNSPGWDYGVSVSSDGLALFIMSGGGYGGCDLWMTTRVGKDQEWRERVNLGPIVNSSIWEYRPCISYYFPGVGCSLYFTRRPGMDPPSVIWETKVSPIVDFNGDDMVDATDICIMADHWGQDYSSCDIGPMPWGDGIVDVQDLIVLAEHLFEDYRLVAHWKLDEIEGDIAYDSAGDNYGTLNGNPIWHPDGGQVAGALQFDGIDDYISIDNVLNPKLVEFSVFAWIKGSSLGQVIISQKSSFGGVGATWLGADTSDGRLITELTSPAASPLESEAVITDGQWHHIGFVWDGSYRRLYVDGIQVAKDSVALAALKPSTGGMYIGVGKDRASKSFFFGLIDDVRIYDLALTAEEIAALAH